MPLENYKDKFAPEVWATIKEIIKSKNPFSEEDDYIVQGIKLNVNLEQYMQAGDMIFVKDINDKQITLIRIGNANAEESSSLF